MSEGGSLIFWLIVGLVERIIFGCITLKINSSKGRDGGFAWGFFLAAIGIIVTATRPSLIEPETTTPSYSPAYKIAQTPAMPAAPKKPLTWKCVSCQKENTLGTKFCSGCGTRRHYNWKCANCGKENAPESKFCPECGNLQTESQELIPQQNTGDEDFIRGLFESNTAAEISAAFSERYADSENENLREMCAVLEKSQKMERTYGNMKNFAVKRLEAFLQHDMQFFPVDRSGPSITCPVCGKVQNSDRDNCFMCGALFKE